MVFLVVMCGCMSWTVKKAKCWRTDAFASHPRALWYFTEIEKLNNLFTVSSELGKLKEISYTVPGLFKDRKLREC